MSTEGSNEKASPSLNNGCLSWLKPKPSDKLDSVSSPEKSPTPDLRITAPAEDEPKPVSFFTLFRSVPVSFHVSTYNLYIVPLRFSTRTELIINGLSLIAAVAAGAALVCT